jgi:acetyltransferase-like isoleucine patch superfamily enzyme
MIFFKHRVNRVAEQASKTYTNTYTKEELLKLGFSKVGDDPMVSKDARFFGVSGTLGDQVRIDAFAILTGRIELGDGVHVSPFCFMGGTGGVIRMGERSGISTHVSIFTKSDDYSVDGKDRGKVSGPVTIGRNSIVGSGSMVAPGVTIGDHVSIGCHAVVNHDIQPGMVLVSRGLGLMPIGGGERP